MNSPRALPRRNAWTWTLLLVALLATWIDLGRVHTFQGADSFIPILVSLQRWTPFFWGQDRFGMLVPLLATPLKTSELLAAKVISAAIPGVLLTTGCFLLYVLLIAAVAEPGVWLAMLTARSLGLVFIVGPLASLLGLQMAVCASSRVNDPRSAQQVGVACCSPGHPGWRPARWPCSVPGSPG